MGRANNAANNAANNPVINKGGVHSESIPLAQPAAIEIPETGHIVREPEALVPADTNALNKQYADALKFDQDELTILLEPSSEENAPTVIDVSVNGRTEWVRVGVETKLKRCYVEGLLRSKPVSIQTSHEDVGAKVINNRILRNTRAKYPLSILNDPAQGKGIEWLRRIRAEL
ncbi:MAG TPA: hypothetical protein VK149_12325 [Sideroxyarcus sp.]|nr:hypothetical protein [Sideroxyarcus sp.]